MTLPRSAQNPPAEGARHLTSWSTGPVLAEHRSDRPAETAMTTSLPPTTVGSPDVGAAPTPAVGDRSPAAVAVPRWRRLLGPRRERPVPPSQPSRSPATTEVHLEVAPDDPLIAFCQQAGGAVDVQGLQLDSPSLRRLKAAGTKLVVPLVTQGELIGLLSLGPRLSERDYSGDDRRLLDTLAGYAAPAVRVGQLVREQEVELVARERMERELHVAQLIQQQFLPKRIPDLPSWHIAAFYRPARTVGGDFYDFIDLPDGRVFIVVGDVTDKGVPAALVMASTHSILRGNAAQCPRRARCSGAPTTCSSTTSRRTCS